MKNKKHKDIKGNLITLAKQGNFDVIVHGCNCFNSMGGGIAAEIAKRCKSAEYIDSYFTKNSDKNKLGKITYSIEYTDNGAAKPLLMSQSLTDSFLVVNAYTQYRPGANFKLSALTKCLKKIKKQFGGMDRIFAFPQIGAGIGGGNWKEIRREIQKHLKDEIVYFVEYDGSK